MQQSYLINIFSYCILQNSILQYSTQLKFMPYDKKFFDVSIYQDGDGQFDVSISLISTSIIFQSFNLIYSNLIYFITSSFFLSNFLYEFGCLNTALNDSPFSLLSSPLVSSRPISSSYLPRFVRVMKRVGKCAATI